MPRKSYEKSWGERYNKTKTFDGKKYTKMEEDHDEHTAILMARDWREAGLNARYVKDGNMFEVYGRTRKRR